MFEKAPPLCAVPRPVPGEIRLSDGQGEPAPVGIFGICVDILAVAKLFSGFCWGAGASDFERSVLNVEHRHPVRNQPCTVAVPRRKALVPFAGWTEGLTWTFPDRAAMGWGAASPVARDEGMLPCSFSRCTNGGGGPPSCSDSVSAAKLAWNRSVSFLACGTFSGL